MNLNLAVFERKQPFDDRGRLIVLGKHFLGWIIYLFLQVGFQACWAGRFMIYLERGFYVLPLLCLCFYGMVYIIRSFFLKVKIAKGVCWVALFMLAMLCGEYLYVYQLLPFAGIKLYREGIPFSLGNFVHLGGVIFIHMSVYALLYLLLAKSRVLVKKLKWVIYRHCLERLKQRQLETTEWNHALPIQHKEERYARLPNMLQELGEQLIEHFLKSGQELFGQIETYNLDRKKEWGVLNQKVENIGRHLEKLEMFSGPAFHMDDCFFIKGDTKGVLTRIDYQEIIYIEAQQKKVRLRLTQGEICVNQRFGEFRAKLPKSMFVKVSRSYVVSTLSIQGTDNKKVQLTDLEEEIPIGNPVESKELTSWLEKKSW